jgi:hypothetical protein
MEKEVKASMTIEVGILAVSQFKIELDKAAFTFEIEYELKKISGIFTQIFRLHIKGTKSNIGQFMSRMRKLECI